MVMFLFGLCVGIIITLFAAIMWGYRLSIKEEEQNKELIKEFADKYIDNMQSDEMKFYKRYKS
jgi:H+/gluconate symporter-like permease|tara:strand:- start:200 stop:388 length:189 start_codon:yes stop_codon:yes gene_type:complete